MGSNEVPKAHGGTYWEEGTAFDAREFTQGFDSNDARKRELLNEVFNESASTISFEKFFSKESVQESQFMDALEYGRIIHAEMSAITDAARLGLSLKGAILYCTTFPCHMCAKLIIASGISNVVFLEPYPKSLANDLHCDALEIEGGPRGKYAGFDAVNFEHFYGITPRRYRELFQRGSRKHNGIFQDYILGNKRPNIYLIEPFYINTEKQVINSGLIAYFQLLPTKG
jgi:deoxycytidylate deaminase